MEMDINRDQKQEPTESTTSKGIVENENKKWLTKRCPHCGYKGKFIVIENKPTWFTSIQGIAGIIFFSYFFWFRNSQYASEFMQEELPYLIVFGLQMIILIIELSFISPKAYKCPTCHFSKGSRRITTIFALILTIILVFWGIIGNWFRYTATITW